MTTRAVIFTRRAKAQLDALYDYIAQEATPVTAERYTTAIADYCQSLATFPERGRARDDIRQGLRITHYRRRTIIAYQLDAATDRVVIHGIYYGGQDFEADAALQRPV